MKKNTIDERFNQLISTKSVFILSNNISTRDNLSRMLRLSDCRPKNIHQAKNLEDALNKLPKCSIDLLLCDYVLDIVNGMDAVKKIRDEIGNPYLSVILLTTNLSEQHLARALEEDVDTYLSRPYTLASVKKAFVNTLYDGSKNNLYKNKIKEAKEYLNNSDYDNAMKILLSSLTLHPAPAISFYYMAQIYYSTFELDLAQKFYLKALRSNKFHYPSLLGLFNTLYEQNKFLDCKKIFKNLTEDYPLNPGVLAKYLVVLSNIGETDHIKEHLKEYWAIDERDSYSDTLIFDTFAKKACSDNTISDEDADFYANMAIMVYLKSSLFLDVSPIIKRYIERSGGKAAWEILDTLPVSLKNDKKFVIIELLVIDHFKHPVNSLSKALDVLQKGIMHPIVYEIALKYPAPPQFKSTLENIYNKAIMRYPNHKEHFDRLYKNF